ncbi:MAG: hypothetical protein ACYTX0_36720 [Nostoc sp.]
MTAFIEVNLYHRLYKQSPPKQLVPQGGIRNTSLLRLRQQLHSVQVRNTSLLRLRQRLRSVQVRNYLFAKV